MNRKQIWSLVAILVLFVVLGYEYILEEKEQANIFSQGEKVKHNTNTYFLPSSTTAQVVHHSGYSLSYSETHEQAEWVAYELRKSHISNTNFKRPYFEIDKAVKTGAAHWRNYKGSGYDRGHLCPAADRSYNKEAHDETFLTSNISPQNHDFNSGVWNRLEQKVRYWAKKYDGVYVITGGVLKGQMKTIGTENVSVPNHFYKVLLRKDSDDYSMIAFLMPHKDSKKPLYQFVVPVNTIEALTHIDFFPKLGDAIENTLEASSDYKNWSF